MDFKTFVITRNAPEHFALIDAVQETKTLCGGIIQKDEPLYKQKPHLSPLIKNAKISTERIFGVKYSHMSNVPTIAINGENINDDNTISFINSCEPNLVIFFDCDDISQTNLDKIKCTKWKIHKGYIEKFKGYEGNFWANYLLLPDYISVTVCLMSDMADNGDIIHQIGSNHKPSDTFHDAEHKSLRNLFYDIPAIIEKQISNKIIFKKQESSGLFFDKNMIMEKHIEVMYEILGAKLFNINLRKPDFYSQI